jgi:hypothetical protein
MKNMPRGDGTGPGGLGPMTGRAAGYCAGYSVPGYRGYGRAYWPANSYPVSPPPVAYGGGFYQPPIEPKQEMEMLAEDAKALKEQLDSINKRITELEKSEKK